MNERQACTALLSNFEQIALKCLVAKKNEERYTPKSPKPSGTDLTSA